MFQKVGFSPASQATTVALHCIWIGGGTVSKGIQSNPKLSVTMDNPMAGFPPAAQSGPWVPASRSSPAYANHRQRYDVVPSCFPTDAPVSHVPTQSVYVTATPSPMVSPPFAMGTTGKQSTSAPPPRIFIANTMLDGPYTTGSVQPVKEEAGMSWSGKDLPQDSRVSNVHEGSRKRARAGY